MKNGILCMTTGIARNAHTTHLSSMHLDTLTAPRPWLLTRLNCMRVGQVRFPPDRCSIGLLTFIFFHLLFFFYSKLSRSFPCILEFIYTHLHRSNIPVSVLQWYESLHSFNSHITNFLLLFSLSLYIVDLLNHIARGMTI